MNMEKTEEVRSELREIEKGCMALRATGGTRFRKHFKASDRELQRYASAVPGALKLTMIQMMAGQMLAERIGKAAELEILSEEIAETIFRGPPSKGSPKESPVGAREPVPIPMLSTGRGNDHGI